jgi:hypothetical protein
VQDSQALGNVYLGCDEQEGGPVVQPSRTLLPNGQTYGRKLGEMEEEKSNRYLLPTKPRALLSPGVCRRWPCGIPIPKQGWPFLPL